MMRLCVLAFAMVAAGCMESKFPWARREPPSFARDVVKEGMNEILQSPDAPPKVRNDPPEMQAAHEPEMSPLNWALEDLKKGR